MPPRIVQQGGKHLSIANLLVSLMLAAIFANGIALAGDEYRNFNMLGVLEELSLHAQKIEVGAADAVRRILRAEGRHLQKSGPIVNRGSA